jgi:hypothetical protein
MMMPIIKESIIIEKVEIIKEIPVEHTHVVEVEKIVEKVIVNEI